MNPQYQEWNLQRRKIMKITLQAKDHIRWRIKILCTSSFQCPQVMKILDAKAAVDKECKKLETIPAWQLEKVKSKKEVIKESQKKKTKK